MTHEVLSVKSTLETAAESFYLDREGRPELIPTGFQPVDDVIGGLGPGSCSVLAASTGVGKSSAVLSAMLNSKLPVGLVSIEDGPDVVGSRLLAAITGVDSMAIRQKNLTKTQLKKLMGAVSSPKISHMFFTYPLAGSIGDIEDCVRALGDEGCRLIFVDYVQKIRGHGKGDRRNEVAESFTRIQRAIAKYPAAGIVVSQFRRLMDSEKVPQIHHLAESGDLEREARVIILAHKEHSPDTGARVRFRLAKSTYGGEFVKFDMVRDPSGTLRDATYYNVVEGF